MPLAGFEPAIPANKRPQTHALDGAATGIGPTSYTVIKSLVKIGVIDESVIRKTSVHRNTVLRELLIKDDKFFIR
jgi:hypothetical protein